MSERELINELIGQPSRPYEDSLTRGKRIRQEKWAARGMGSGPNAEAARRVADGFLGDMQREATANKAAQEARLREHKAREALRKERIAEGRSLLCGGVGNSTMKVTADFQMDCKFVRFTGVKGTWRVNEGDPNHYWWKATDLHSRGDPGVWYDLGWTFDGGQSWHDTKPAEGKLWIAPLDPNARTWPDGWSQVGYTSSDGMTQQSREIDMYINKLVGKTFSFKMDGPNASLMEKLFNPAVNNTDVPMIRKAKTMMDDYNASAEALEEAATRMVALAGELRVLDGLEPQGEEPTISFTHDFSQREGATQYTFVAFKAANGRWYVTGDTAGYEVVRSGLTWRDLAKRFPSVKAGDFLVAAKWVKAGGK